MALDPAPSMLVMELDLRERAPSDAVVDGAVRSVRDQGLRLSTLAREGDGGDARQALYGLVREGVVDDPSGDGSFVPFGAFEAELYEPYYLRWADAQFLAMRGERWVGLVNPQLRTERLMELGISVVRRPYRRRGIARALKLLALRYARDRGIERVRTRNDPRNEAILALNRSLGFVEVDG